MNTKNNVVDVSPFLLFETSADSAETHQERDNIGDDDQGYADYDDDEKEVVAGEKKNHDEVSSYQRWTERKEGEIMTVDTSSTRNDEKLAREIEKNRMFWEACLAS
ncbi:hypothetical protein V5N11_027511 [Cardamine amara subsp. amara]|uniref:Uncharacterized protein n=1 Tax=Cardamine amara subsp. amara TaxID=228776 RepID=A0ABD0ZTD1_CARAN